VTAIVKHERVFREVDDLVLQLKGLVLVRELLKDRGASEPEIRSHSEEIERVRARLADLVQSSGGGALSAAT
jgi:hypothetical protein